MGVQIDSSEIEALLNKYEVEHHSKQRLDACIEIRQRFRELVDCVSKQKETAVHTSDTGDPWQVP